MDRVADQVHWNRRVDAFIINLAYEGVPQRAIARALRLPADEVEEVITDAVNRGIIVVAPGMEWPRGSRFVRSPLFAGPPIDDEAMLLAAVRVFHITKLQAALFLTLIRRKACTKEILHNVIESRRVSMPVETDWKMVDVVICHLRRRLKDAYTIVTIWACGYQMPEDDRKRAADQLLAYFDADPGARQLLSPAEG